MKAVTARIAPTIAKPREPQAKFNIVNLQMSLKYPANVPSRNALKNIASVSKTIGNVGSYVNVKIAKIIFINIKKLSIRENFH